MIIEISINLWWKSKGGYLITQFDQESGRQRTTLRMCFLQIIIYLFINYYVTKWFYQKVNDHSAKSLLSGNAYWKVN